MALKMLCWLTTDWFFFQEMIKWKFYEEKQEWLCKRRGASYGLCEHLVCTYIDRLFSRWHDFNTTGATISIHQYCNTAQMPECSFSITFRAMANIRIRKRMCCSPNESNSQKNDSNKYFIYLSEIVRKFIW